MRNRALIIAGLVVVFFVGAIWGVHRGPVPLPKIPEASGHCVLPTAEIRRDHRMLLRAVREEMVRHKTGNPADRLTNCISCHVQKNAAGKFIPVNAHGQFCQACHVYAGVKPDCFVCHAAVPEKPFAKGSFVNGGAVPTAFPVPSTLSHSMRVPVGDHP
ncbi:MAG TPA: hypothetical protein VMV40_01915 [Acidiferrobacter sp.]|nr:hypothetical protein [Acidiferrobacter sp.]